MTDPALLLVIADAAVTRQRAAWGDGRGGWEDMAGQRLTLALLIEAEERTARLRCVGEWADLPELRETLANLGRMEAEAAAKAAQEERAYEEARRNRPGP